MSFTSEYGNHRPMQLGVYALLLGLLMGLLLGPMVLGRIMPDRYVTWFPDPPMIRAQLDEIQQSRRTLEMTDVTLTALAEFDQQRQAEIHALDDLLMTARQRQDLMNMLILAALCALLVMNMTTRDGWLFTRLHLGAHLLLAGWLCLLLAQPYLLAHLPGWLLLGALLMVLGICFIPCGKCKTTPPAQTSTQSET